MTDKSAIRQRNSCEPASHRIFVKAFLDKNFGDDHMLLKLLRFFPQERFYVSCPQENLGYYERLLRGCSNCELTQVELRQISRHFPNGFFSYLLLLGGSVLQGSRNLGCYYRGRNIRAIRRAKRWGTKYLIVGCNTGPFINALTKAFVCQEIAAADLVTTRDSASYALVQDALKGRGRAFFTGDLLWDISADFPVEGPPEAGRLGISVLGSNRPELCSEALVRYFAKIVDLYLQEEGRQVSLLALNAGGQDDMRVAKQICSHVQRPERVRIVRHGCDSPWAILQETAACERVIGLRYHSIIGALSYGTPVLPIAYSNKTQRLLADYFGEAEPIQLQDLLKIQPEEFFSQYVQNEDRYLSCSQKQNGTLHLEWMQAFLKEN